MENYKFNKKYNKDKGRLKPFLNELCEVWEDKPYLRFMQLIFCITKNPENCFHLEDEDFIRLLINFKNNNG